jgi:hypothetical protein
VDFIGNGKEYEKNEGAMFRNGTQDGNSRKRKSVSGNCQKSVNANLQLRRFGLCGLLIVSGDSSARFCLCEKEDYMTLNLTRLLVLLAMVLLAAPALFANEIAVATYTDSQVSPGVFQYDVTLTDTGTTKIGTFWFGWIPGVGFLSAMPTSIVDPTGWNAQLTEPFSILFTTATPLSPGGSAVFQFNSTETPAQLLGTFGGPGPGVGDPVTTFFTYSGGPFSDAGFQSAATPAPVVATPEPVTISFLALAMGLLVLGTFLKKRDHRHISAA